MAGAAEGRLRSYTLSSDPPCRSRQYSSRTPGMQHMPKVHRVPKIILTIPSIPAHAITRTTYPHSIASKETLGCLAADTQHHNVLDSATIACSIRYLRGPSDWGYTKSQTFISIVSLVVHSRVCDLRARLAIHILVHCALPYIIIAHSEPKPIHLYLSLRYGTIPER